jgi:hypothetical protein
MTWFTESANQTEAGKSHVRMFVAVALDFPSGFVRVWSGVGDITILSNTYTGIGELGSISIPVERAGLNIDRKTFQLSGVDLTLAPESELEGSFGRSVTEYFGFLNTETGALVGDPEVNWEGRIDAIRRVDGANPTIEVNAESRMVLLDQTDAWRYTHEHQQQFFAGDNGFDQVAAIQQKEVVWAGGPVDPGISMPDPYYSNPYYFP